MTTINVKTKADPLGTIRRNCCSLRLAREPSEEPGGQWRIGVTAIYHEGDEALGAVVVSPGKSSAADWQPEAFEVGIIAGSRVEAGIVETFEAIVDAILNGTELEAKHGFNKAEDCPYKIPMQPQESVAWVRGSSEHG
jgi:hypothetical protein